MNKISIIIPVYNKEKYLKECINSLLNQTSSDFEAIFINDGSTDNSLKILKEYENNPNFKIINQKNHGPGHARNQGLKNATGEYILFLDADDYLKDDTLEKLYKTAKNNNSEIVLFNAVEHHPNNKTKERIYHIHTDKDTNLENFTFDYTNNINLIMNGYHIVCTKLHKLAFIRENNLQFNETNLFEDIYFHIKTMIKAKRISYNPEIFYHYRRTDKKTRQNSTITTNKSLIIFDIFIQIEKLLNENNLQKKLEINFIRFKINECYNIFNNIEEQYKKEAYTRIKDEFHKLNLNNKQILRLPENHQIFYRAIISSKTLKNYKKQEKIIKTKQYPINILKKIKHSLIK